MPDREELFSASASSSLSLLLEAERKSTSLIAEAEQKQAQKTAQVAAATELEVQSLRSKFCQLERELEQKVEPGRHQPNPNW